MKCHGTRWINYKRRALQGVVNWYGVYIAHLSALANDHSVKASDRAQLEGYSKKWTCAKFVFGCALYIDALNLHPL